MDQSDSSETDEGGPDAAAHSALPDPGGERGRRGLRGRHARPPACWRPPARPAIIPQTSRPSLHRSQNTSSKPVRSSYASTNCAPGRKSISCSRRLGRKLPACFRGCPKASVTNWVTGSDRASPAPGAGGRRSGTGPAAGPGSLAALGPSPGRIPAARHPLRSLAVAASRLPAAPLRPHGHLRPVRVTPPPL